MKLDAGTRIAIANALQTPELFPDWVKEALSLQPNELVTRFKIDLEDKVVTDDYLGFLSEQIGLNARGEEWSAVLARRRAALTPFLGTPLRHLSISGPKGMILMKYEPGSNAVVLVEVHD